MNTFSPVVREALRRAVMHRWYLTPLVGKRPIEPRWPDTATNNPVHLEDFAKKYVDCNFGVVTGQKSGVVVLDVDPKHGGDDTLAKLEAEHGALPQTVQVLTGGGGHHYYFQCPTDLLLGNSAGLLGPGLDFKATNGQVVLPCGIHPETKKAYEWEVAHHPDDISVAPLPSWLIRLLTTEPPAPAEHPEEIADGQRNEILWRKARSLRKSKAQLSREALRAALHVENRQRCRPPLPDQEVDDVVEHAWTGFDRKDFASAESAASVTIDMEHEEPWPTLDPVAIRGVIGELVRAIEPHSEADPVAILVQLLIAYGSLLNRGPYFQAEADRHYMNLNAVLVGITSKGRKGTSWGHVRSVCQTVDADWATARIVNGLSSGEGMIWAVRDEIAKDEAIREQGMPTGAYRRIVVDRGVSDKRLLVLEAEFASTLRVMGREGSTLSAVIRQAWDCGNLRTMTKNSPAQATGAHISIVAHITKMELCRLIAETEAANGFCNRFLWLCVRRSKLLPEGGRFNEVSINPLVQRLYQAVLFGRRKGELQRDEAARLLWRQLYPSLSGEKPGLLGAVTSRGEAQVMRLASLYALQDCSDMITPEHLSAALALWHYCEASARYIFGQRLGDVVADELLAALRRDFTNGMTRTEIRDWFGRNRKAHEIDRGLGVLAKQGLARKEDSLSGGRPIERWFAVSGGTT